MLTGRFERARLRLTALVRATAGASLRDLARVAGGVLAVLVALWLSYLAVGNGVLRSGLIEKAVAGADGFHLRFGPAYTLWPGRVHVRDFALRFEDYNVQFQIQIDDATLDVALSELPFKKFRVTRLLAAGTRFRMRHKVIAVGQDAERVAAYPPIPGFADPPYYVGVRSPSISRDHHDLWQVTVQNVSAQVRELWIMEYRFVGAGEARGSFVIKPSRWVQVEPARLVLEDGRLTLGDHLVAEHARGRITCDVPDMDVERTEGRGVFREISTSIRLELSRGKLDFLQAYLSRFAGASYAGDAEIRLDVNVVRGVVQPASRISLRASPLEVRKEGRALTGTVAVELFRPPPDRVDERSDELWLVMTAPLLDLERSGASTAEPRLEGMVGSMRLRAVDLAGELKLGPARLALGKLRVPDLGWFGDRSLRLSGRAEASLNLELDEDRTWGSVTLQASRLEVVRGDVRLVTDADSELAFVRTHDGPLSIQPLRLTLTNFSIGKDDDRTEPVRVVVEGRSSRFDPGATAFVSLLDVDVSSSRALLPLLLGAPLRELSDALLDLGALRGRVALEVGSSGASVQVLDAASGRLRLRGHWTQRRSAQRGAFLVSSGPLHVGVTLTDGNTEVSPFVAADWLTTDRARPSRDPR